MKKATILTLFALAAVAGHAEHATQKNQVVTSSSKAVENTVASVKLTADEQAFAAKLNDQNRHSFSEKLSSEQRQAVMVAAKNGADANEAVAHLITAQDLKSGSVADADPAQPETEAVK